MPDPVCFKIYLEYGDIREIRKFSFSDSVVASYTNFAKKVESVFPDLQGKEFTIQWQDCSGDYINVSSDEELTFAISEMRSLSTFKFYVLKAPEEVRSGAFDATAKNPLISVKFGAPTVTYRCMCNHCDFQIHEYRYKCLECDDYDLCAKCEAQGIHSMHFMLRIPNATSNWRHKLQNILQKFMVNTAYLTAAEKHAHKHGHKCGRNRRTCRRIAKAEEAMKYFGINLKDLQSDEKADAKFDFSSHVLDGIKEMLEKCAMDLVDEDESNESSNKAKGNKKSATNQRKDECTECEREPSTSQDVESDKAETVDEWMLVDENESTSPDDKKKSKAQVQEKSKTGGESANVLESESSQPMICEPMISNDGEVKKVENPPESHTPRDPSDGRLYPDLDDTDRIFHPNPKIQAAVRFLLEMGFENTGGLLTYLVVAADGNVEKVLDILLRR